MSTPGDVTAGIAELMDHYESDGPLVLNLLAQAAHGSFASDAAARGREYHRAWVERCFGPLIAEPTTEAADALVATTDLHVWKLLRRDLGRSAEATRRVMTRLVRAVLEDE